MHRIRIIHETAYHYHQPVAFGRHAAMLRPREGHDLHIDEARLDASPPASLQWLRDIYGNSIALLDFKEPSDCLRVSSECLVTIYDDPPLPSRLAPEARAHPFQYPPGEQVEIIPFRLPNHPDDGHAIAGWLDGLRPPGEAVPTTGLLNSLNSRVFESIRYEHREEAGTQSPARTLALGTGSCRDYAVLFMEAARHMGFAARFVTGYVLMEAGQHGATHAWAEVYLPGAGWAGFDPTNNKPAGPEHVSVAVARDQSKASPLSGTWSGPADAFKSMDVTVRVFPA